MLLANRKSQGMPINTIIIAVLALVVLVVLIMVFTGKIKILSSGLDSCAGQQGDCKPTCNDNEAFTPNAKCPEQGDSASDTKCCIRILNV